MRDTEKKIKFITESTDIYGGWKNTAIRYYFYTKKGLDVLNEFRYLAMCIFGVCYFLKITSWSIMAIMFAASIPALMVIGFMSLHHMDKVIEFLSLRHATMWSKYGYEMQEKNVENIQKIKDLLEQRKQYTRNI